MIQGLNYLLSK